jgi:iron-sulfur cluster assembly accessory protein|tara:strand:- start:217 stop:540 length:324 start_codon:yes stop_codon:yes gene_type:complete
MNITKKIEFTDQAIKQIEKIVLINTPKKYFRISVKGGGCSGFKYNFTFDDKMEKDDLVFNKTLIDKESLNIINGSIIDYKKEMIGDSFVIKNPKASSSCGCGLSFSV